LSDHIILYHFA